MTAQDWHALKWSWEEKGEIPDWIDEVNKAGDEKVLVDLIERYVVAREILSVYINHRVDSLPEEDL